MTQHCHTILLDCGATDTLLRESDTPLLQTSTIHPTDPFIVSLPNSSTIESTKAATLLLSPSGPSIPVHIFPDDCLSASLLAVNDITNAGCTVTLTDQDFTVVNASNAVLFKQSRQPASHL